MELKGRGQNRKKRSGWWLVGILLVLLLEHGLLRKIGSESKLESHS